MVCAWRSLALVGFGTRVLWPGRVFPPQASASLPTPRGAWSCGQASVHSGRGRERWGTRVCVCVCVCVLGGSRKAGFSQKTWVQAPWLPSGSDPRTNSSVEGLNGERRSQNHVDELGDS